MLKVKLHVEHSPDCVSVRDPEQVARKGPSFVWFVDIHQEHERRLDARGGARGDGWKWLRVGCNDPRCPGEVLVRVDSIAAEIVKALDEMRAG